MVNMKLVKAKKYRAAKEARKKAAIDKKMKQITESR